MEDIRGVPVKITVEHTRYKKKLEKRAAVVENIGTSSGRHPQL
jgi:hypothetical protein